MEIIRSSYIVAFYPLLHAERKKRPQSVFDLNYLLILILYL